MHKNCNDSVKAADPTKSTSKPKIPLTKARLSAIRVAIKDQKFNKEKDEREARVQDP